MSGSRTAAADAVQANLLAATVDAPEALNEAYNVAVGRRTTLDELFVLLRDRLTPRHPHLRGARAVYGPPRAGDVAHSLADISKARRLLGYEPTHSIEQGLDEALDWYRAAIERLGLAEVRWPRIVPQGSVVGIDMLPEMLERSRRAAQQQGLSNVEFREGLLEQRRAQISALRQRLPG